MNKELVEFYGMSKRDMKFWMHSETKNSAVIVNIIFCKYCVEKLFTHFMIDNKF